MNIERLRERINGYDSEEITKYYHYLTFLVFSTGIALAFTSLIDPHLPIAIVHLIFPDEPYDTAQLLKVSPGIILFLYGILTTGASILMYLIERTLSIDRSLSTLWESSLTSRMLTANSFIATFVFVRAVVAVSGVVGPGTVGHAGAIPVIQIALPGFRIHHYMFGMLTMIFIIYRMLFHESYSEKLMSVLFGVSLGLFIDEVGLILTQGDYFTLSTYVFAVVFATILFIGIYSEIESHGQSDQG